MNKVVKIRHDEVSGIVADEVKTPKGIPYTVLCAAAFVSAVLTLFFGITATLPVVSPKGAHIVIGIVATAPKLIGGALAPFVMLFGGLGTALGLLLSWMNRARWSPLFQRKAGSKTRFRLALGGPMLVFASVIGTILAGLYIHRVTAAPAEFEKALESIGRLRSRQNWHRACFQTSGPG